jgi:hypothetical protein
VNPTEKERKAIQQTRQRIMRLGAFFAKNPPPEADSAPEWFAYLANFKEELGNINNDVSFFATLLAQAYLLEHLDIRPFDAAAKAQGAPGLDIDEQTKGGERIIAEIKTTHPYLGDDLGAQQKTTFAKDAAKLRKESARHKFFFLTDKTTFAVMNKLRYRALFQGVTVVLLPSGEELS